MKFNTIPEVIEDIKNGRMVIVVDDEDRENEGDFVMAGSLVTHKDINFMARHGRGLICAPMEEEGLNKLNLYPMVSTQADPGRDTTIIEGTPIDYLDFASPDSGLGAKMGLDATTKIPPETSRQWGRPIRMSDDVIEKVTAMWAELGLPGSGKPIWK